MNPNIPHHMMGSYPPHYTHVNPAKFNLQWNQAVPGPSSVRGNFIHVNPAFFQPSLPPPTEIPHPKRIIVNPKFFPQVQHEIPSSVSVEQISLAQLHNKVSIVNTNRIVMHHKAKAINPISNNDKVEKMAGQHVQQVKPSPIRHVADKNKLTKLNFNNSQVRSKYQWRKVESPQKTAAIKHTYKLVRKAPLLKSPKLSTLLTLRSQNDSFKILTPPKLTSTPIENRRPTNTRFRLDNRSRTKKKAIKGSSPRVSFPKILQNKYKLIRNKIWKPSHLTLAKLTVNRSVVNRSFTNFKSPLCRPVVHHSRKLQRLANVVKPNKSIKKTKTTKKKTRKRYYDDEAKAKSDDEVLGDVEIAEKPSGPKIRTPLGALPSFITL